MSDRFDGIKIVVIVLISKTMTNRFCLIGFVILNIVLLPRSVFAAVVINEVMYDLPGTDTKREWVELFNNGSSDVDLTGWKFNDGSNHNLVAPPDNGGQGSLTIPAGGFVILTSDASTFLSENSVSVSVIDTVMAPANSADTLSLIDNNDSVIDLINYDSAVGAVGDGNSLQKNSSGSFIAALPTPGLANKEVSENPPNTGDSGTGTSTASTTPTDNSTGVTNNSTGGGGSFSAHSSSAPLSIAGSPIKFEVSAGRERISVVDNPVAFDGVVTRGGDFSNPSFTWSFGDGTGYSSKSVYHSYALPGTYEVVLNAVSGSDKAVSRTRVVVIKPEVVIEMADFSAGYLTLKNKSGKEVNLGDWKISNGAKDFTFPADTLIVPGGTLPVAFGVLGFSIGSTTQTLTLKDAQNKEMATVGNSLSNQTKDDLLGNSLTEIESKLALVSAQVNILALGQMSDNQTVKLTMVEDEPKVLEVAVPAATTKIATTSNSDQLAGVGAIPIVIPKPAGWYDSLKNLPTLGFRLIRGILGQ